MNRRLLALALAALCGTAHAQLVVVDPGLASLTKANAVKQIADMANQLRTAQSQLTQARATFDSLNGSRGISGLLRNPALYGYLPQDLTTVMRTSTTSLPSAETIRAGQRLLGIEDTGLDPKSATATNFTARQIGNANIQLLNEQGYQATSNRIKQLDAMVNSIDGATDPMKINALAVRVQAEQGLIANEQARLNILASMAANAERVREQQSREIIMKSTRGPVPDSW